MASILDGLNIAKLSLSAQQYAMNVSQRNTVNANNYNYTRQDVLFTDLTVTENWSTSGVPGVNLSATRNRYLDQSISYGYSSLTENIVKYNALYEIDAILQAVSGGGLGSSIDAFFNSFTELSSNPTDSALRWQVLSSAQTMTEDFKRIYESIQSVQASLNRKVEDGVNDINTLTSKIADLNGRIEAAQKQSQKETEYALRDERQQYIEELTGKANFLYFETESGSVTVTTTKGDALVLGNKSTKLVLGNMTDSHFSGIYLGNNSNPDNDITSTITSGEIGGYLQMRDTLIPGYLKTLDNMAADIVNRVNDVHSQGVYFDGAGAEQPGDNFFIFSPLTTPPASNPNADAARTMRVVIDDPSKIAAASVGMGVGDNGNAKKLAGIASEKSFGNNNTETIGEAYASLVYKVGSDQRTAKEAGENQQRVLTQLLGQRDASSGVSFNEEAINLIKYQRAYQASSRIVSILNDLSIEVLNFVR
ncbi:MAG: flagellar hook-associated protein FlgK [Acidobacteriota bacterium]|jgi:flagellar hook-associated protein 1 FlgK|nr:flagellar hook-associated protein FlgK [Acidobacteriota bacterium]